MSRVGQKEAQEKKNEGKWEGYLGWVKEKGNWV